MTSQCSLFLFLLFKKDLCINYLWLGWLFVAMRGLLTVVASLVAEHRLSSPDLPVYLLQGMWDLPGPGIKPVSLALQGGFSTIVPPRKPYSVVKPHGQVQVFFLF